MDRVKTPFFSSMKQTRNKAKNPDKKMTQPDATRRVKRQYFLTPKPRRKDHPEPKL
ncbi:hypothetical protein Bb109J_c2946 [Bdellovibrio bacteriovorus]|nr:hypothetical protein Bb109J_c2946 [Bdellovibrio bacteriovorus]